MSVQNWCTYSIFSKTNLCELSRLLHAAKKLLPARISVKLKHIVLFINQDTKPVSIEHR